MPFKKLLMKRFLSFALFVYLVLLSKRVDAQVDEDKVGLWSMYFFSTKFNDGPWGIQGDVQYRNWDFTGDLEQLLLRSGVTYSPKDVDIKFTLGYGHITTGQYGDSNETSQESRVYQEALFPVQFGNRFFTNHRFRYEQRFVDGQDFRTRFRYNLFLNVALNKAEMSNKTVYLALYNELFINGERRIGENRYVDVFDRNRFYTAIGYVIKKGMKIQLGAMRQTTNSVDKYQGQVSFHHTF